MTERDRERKTERYRERQRDRERNYSYIPIVFIIEIDGKRERRLESISGEFERKIGQEVEHEVCCQF